MNLFQNLQVFNLFTKYWYNVAGRGNNLQIYNSMTKGNHVFEFIIRCLCKLSLLPFITDQFRCCNAIVWLRTMSSNCRIQLYL